MADFNPGREQVQVTAAPILQSEKARFDPEGGVNKLLEALGTQRTQDELLKFNEAHEANKLKEQTQKIDWYTEQFKKDHEGGAVSQAQVKGRFPETVPIIAARIAENIGASEGAKRFQGVVDAVNADDNLRLDTNARNAFLAQKRAEIVKGIEPGNDFYGNGVVQAMDKLVSQHSMNWETQTAQYHERVQADAFSGEVANAFNGSGDPREALLAIDQNWSKSSSLNNLDRNKLVVKTAIDTAFTNDDPKVFGMVPLRFLNADAKADLEKARVQLQDRRMTDFRNGEYLRTVQREQATREAKIQMVTDVAQGKPIDPAMYRGDADQFEFAMKMREAPRIDESTSVNNADQFRSSILDSATTGRSAAPLSQLRDAVLHHPTMNPKDKQKLLDDLPKLVEGRNLMADDLVRQPVIDVLGPALHALETTPNATLQTLLQGRNLRAEVMRGYDMDIRRSFNAEFEETGKWPVGHRKLELVDKAVERASKKIESMSSIEALKQSAPAPKAAAPSPAPAPAPKPAAPASSSGTTPALPKGVTLLSR